MRVFFIIYFFCKSFLGFVQPLDITIIGTAHYFQEKYQHLLQKIQLAELIEVDDNIEFAPPFFKYTVSKGSQLELDLKDWSCN